MSPPQVCVQCQGSGSRELLNLCIYECFLLFFKFIVLHEERKKKVGGLL